MSAERREHVFLVRMWSESADQSSEAWRGSIHDISSGRKLYLTGPAEVADFIAFSLRTDPNRDEKR